MEFFSVLILSGNPEHMLQKLCFRRAQHLICDCSRSIQMPSKDQITVSAQLFLTYHLI